MSKNVCPSRRRFEIAACFRHSYDPSHIPWVWAPTIHRMPRIGPCTMGSAISFGTTRRNLRKALPRSESAGMSLNRSKSGRSLGFPSTPAVGFHLDFLRMEKKRHAAKKDRAAAVTAAFARCGRSFLSGTRGESINRKPNCSRFLAIISRSTS